jgi:hypothetical protein
MKIRNKIVFVYDIEVFPNIFHCTIKNTETNELIKFEISPRINQIYELIRWFKQFDYALGWSDYFDCKVNYESDRIICGYNNLHYDNPIINYIIDQSNKWHKYTVATICQSIYHLSNIIIQSDDVDRWKKWKYMIWFDTFDLLTMLYSKKLRVGLKELQITMKYRNVQEFHCEFGSWLEPERFEEMIDYNINDVESTEELLKRCEKDIELRIGIQDQYNVNVLSKDGMTIGMTVLREEYLRKTGLHKADIEDLRSPMDFIPLNDVILPFITYQDPLLQGILAEMKKQTVSPGRKGYEKEFVYAGCRFQIGVGGIHTKNTPESIIPNDDEILIDCDVASLYPSLLIEYGFAPKHLGKEFIEVFTEIRTKRLTAKKAKDKITDGTLKLALNGLTGNLQNEHSWAYDPFAVMCIRINGQLLLLMLIEKLANIGCRIIQANTDGIFTIVKKDCYDEVSKVCKEWEQLTHLTLEEERFEAMFQYAINDYICVQSGFKDKDAPIKVKTKGMFIQETVLGKGLTPKIIPTAIVNYVVKGIPIETTIRECDDITMFLMGEKTGRQWVVEYNDKVVQRTNRFYASTNGPFLWKYKIEGDIKHYQNMLVASGVTILNTLDDKPINERRINYAYYLSEARKIIEELQPRQLKLF